MRATLAGKSGDLKPGTYTLRKDMSYGDVLDRLAKGPGSDVLTVTIPEGLSRAEAAPIVRKAGVRRRLRARQRVLERLPRPRLRRPGPAATASRASCSRPPTSCGGAPRPPSSWRSSWPPSSRTSRTVDSSYAKSKNLTIFDVVTIASMVERETSVAKERPLVAAVIYNRLREGQPLGIDATVRFATGNWTRPLTRSELAGDSPYNTRNRAGLPPGPIGSPGLASLKAAARPAKVGYLYYVVKPGACGEHAFSSTFAQFERDRARYEAAREAAGGRSPTDCP